MTQTLNFGINVDQSGIPGVINNLQSAIQSQLQAGAMQMGGMTANVASMMNSLSSVGANPAAQTMAYSMSPGAINREHGKQPFIDRYTMMMGMTDQAYSAVRQHAASIIDTRPGGPTTATTAQRMFVGAAGVVADTATLMLSSAISSPLMGKGWIKGILGFAGAQSLTKPLIGDRITSFARHMSGVAKLPEIGTPEYYDMLGKMVNQRDITSIFAAMGPQEKIGTRSISQENAIRFGKNITDMLGRMHKAQNNNAHFLQYAGNPTDFTSMMTAVGIRSKEGRELAGELSQYIDKGGVPEHLIQRLEKHVGDTEKEARSHGFEAASDPNFIRYQIYRLTSGAAERYKGPNRWQIMGRQMGFQSGLTEAFGEAVMNKSVRFDAVRDLGLNREQRKMLGGTYGIGAAYGSSIIQEASVFGSQLSMMYAAAASGSIPGHISQLGPAAARIMSDPGSYFQFRLNYKDTVSRGGGAAAVAMHKKHIGMQAEHLMQMHPTGFNNRYEARRAVYEMQYNMAPEEAAMRAAMDESVGMRITGKGGGKESLTSIMGSEEAAIFALKDSDPDKYGKMSPLELQHIVNAKRFDRKKYVTSHEINRADAAEINMLLADHGSIEEAEKAATDPKVKGILKKMIGAGLTRTEVLVGGKTDDQQRNLIIQGAVDKDIEVTPDLSYKYQHVLDAKGMRKMKKGDLHQVIDLIAEGTDASIAEANAIARKHGVNSDEIGAFAGEGGITKENKEQYKKAFDFNDKNTTYIPQATGGYGLYNSEKNDEELARIFSRVATIFQTRSKSPVKDTWQK